MNIKKRSTDNKSKNIPIVKNLLYSEYSQTANCFDPSKQSPPNEFIIKLQIRISNYTNNIKVNDLAIK